MPVPKALPRMMRLLASSHSSASAALPALSGGQTARKPAYVVALVVAAGLLLGGPARADIWAYVDAAGTAHFSAERLDERYELFVKGQESFAVGKGQALAPALAGQPVRAPGGALAPPAKLLSFFEVSPNYKAVTHLLRDASSRHGIDYELLQALIATESGFNTHAVSPKGAVGLMQLIPPTAQRYGVRADKENPIEKKLTDPRINIPAGSRYLSDLIAMFPGQLELALAAYNAGEGAVMRAGNKIPNYPETRNYVKTVMQLYTHLKPPAAIAEVRRAGRVRMEMMRSAPATPLAVHTPSGPETPTASKPAPGQD